MPKDVILFRRAENGFTHPVHARELHNAGFNLGIIATGADMRGDVRHRDMLAAGITSVTDPDQWWTEVYRSTNAIVRQGWHIRDHRDIQYRYDIRFTHFLNDIEDWMTKLFNGPHAWNWSSPDALGSAARLDIQHMLAVFEQLKDAASEFGLTIADWAQYGLPRRAHPGWPAGSVNVAAAMAYTLHRAGIRSGNAIYPFAVWDTMVGPLSFAQSTGYDMLVIYPCWRDRIGRPYADPREYLSYLKPKPNTQFWLWDDYTHHGKNAERNRDWALEFLKARKEMYGVQPASESK